MWEELGGTYSLDGADGAVDECLGHFGNRCGGVLVKKVYKVGKKYLM